VHISGLIPSPKAHEENQKWRLKVVELVGEGLRAKTFEHSDIFPILGEIASSWGGATITIRLYEEKETWTIESVSIHPRGHEKE
jgi:hypothetical protein